MTSAFLPGLLLAARLASAAPVVETPQLWEPDQATAFLLGGPSGARRAAADDAGAVGAWDGGLGSGVARALFGTYHVVLSSQDLPTCGFSPSCSRFAQRALWRCGPIQGALLTLDRLLRDHALARGFYPAAEGHLLRDDPERYCLTALE
ncbi:MAG TPA: membrane protein insertion efficiency factor YidD [Polyangia bacterium]|nr:membrane protein insertion efficiency factor YidD [Polyangia bacterium]